MQQVLIAGRYRLLHTVGRGGMGRVWLARDEMLHRDVAVKEIVPPDWMTESEREDLRRRTLREARTAARLNHPNVVRVYDVIHTGDTPWIVMEYVASRSVQEVLQTEGPFPPLRAAEIGREVLAALRAAHHAGVLHRDVKPHNVLISDEGRVVLTDFGLATVDGGDGAMTRAGIVLGSPQYVAPERAAEGRSSVEADLWSLGATLYAAVEGRSPYARSTAMATLTALAVAPPDRARRAGPLRPVLNGLLRRDPRQRLTADEVDRLLRRITDAGPRTPRHPLARPRRPEPAREPAPAAPVVPVETPPSAGSATSIAFSTPPGVRRRPGWRAATAVTAGLVLLAALGTALTVQARQDADRMSAVVPGASPTPPSPPPPAPAFPCSARSDVTTRVTEGPPPSGERYALVPGWTWYGDPSGFRIAAPIGWRVFNDGPVVCFQEPDGPRVLSVDPSTDPTSDAQAYWRAEEARLTDRGALPGYSLVNIGPLDFHGGGAEWECRWTNAAGKQVHTNRMLFHTSPSRAYTIAWLTPEFDWQVNRVYLPMLRLSFRPAG
ncbi:serine/threonine protein kinase [Micromonospora sp. NBC_01699]|uniref:serine/threonine-protein kinase n=1 Tax=Micromonospora sp. NBC_01699 TaxID=2975984 RepID=UPI002E2B8FBA|nr:serine/threonine-protein kinase [Micromonospora sp. NBC_01699]